LREALPEPSLFSSSILINKVFSIWIAEAKDQLVNVAEVFVDISKHWKETSPFTLANEEEHLQDFPLLFDKGLRLVLLEEIHAFDPVVQESNLAVSQGLLNIAVSEEITHSA
jgi:hypothetical protein